MPTIAVIWLSETMVKEAVFVVPRVTVVVPVKLEPLIVIVVPGLPDVGVKLVMLGVEPQVKAPRLAVPEGVVTDTIPDAPLPTVAVIVVAELTVKVVAATPPKLTAVAPVKLIPVMVTTVPPGP